MAIDMQATGQLEAVKTRRRVKAAVHQPWWLKVLHATASLKLAVTLFALAIFIILVGTLAQVHKDMWQVMSEYFRAWICFVEAPLFFPPTWFPGLRERPDVMRLLVAGGAMIAAGVGAIPCLVRIPQHRGWWVASCLVLGLGFATAAQTVFQNGFLFPGGATIGALMVVNLLSAHALRFTIQARGTRLAAALVTLTIGVVLTWQVIAAGHNPEGLQAVPAFEWSTLWLFCKIGLTLLSAATLAGAVRLAQSIGWRRIEVALAGACTFLLVLLTGWVWWGGEAAYLGDAGMRILWQLIQGQFVALVLLYGCLLAFRKRGGVVLIHAGIGLLMLGEWFVSWYAVEERLIIQEGQSANYAVDIRATELAFVDPNYSATEDDVVVVPGTMLAAAGQRGETIRHPDLPFDVQVERFMPNSDLAQPSSEHPNPATAGTGLQLLALPKRSSSGTDTGGGVDMASAYIQLLDKQSGKALGTYLATQFLETSERVKAGDRTYELALRFRRTYKPYTMHLIDVRKDDYIGTSTPRDYSSYVHLIDTKHNIDRDRIRIWMNNPLRYAGETFYQSGYHRDPRSGVETTTLQVVTNAGWMIPYVACMLVGTGMFAHFWNLLLRFVQRRARDTELTDAALLEPSSGTLVDRPARPAGKRRKEKSAGIGPPASGGRWSLLIVPVLVGLVCLAWAAGRSRPPATPSGDFNFVEFGKLPVVYEGRVKPIDTLARNTLQKISDYETFRDKQGDRRSAVEWFLDTVAAPHVADHHRVFRIYNPDVLQTLGLEARRGFHYSLAEVRGSDEQVRHGLHEFEEQVRKARALDAADMDLYQRKLLETDGRFRTYTLLAGAFQPMELPPLPTREEVRNSGEPGMQRVLRLFSAVSQSERVLEQMQAPLAVPQLSPTGNAAASAQDKPWLAYAAAVNRAYLQQWLGERRNPAVSQLQAIFAAYAKNDPVAFNREVAAYHQLLADQPPYQYDSRKVAFESTYNHAAPFYLATVLYMLAFILGAAAWLGWSRPLNRTAFVVILVAFLIHTVGLVARVYISGRPPVTNLYSSAVFIGWGCVLFGLVLEAIYKLGIGNVVAAVSGFAALLVAAFLGLRGDTFTVLQAVLDTQFWLATHVVTITLGYAVTFVAGVLGILYIGMGFFTRRLTPELGRVLARMIYGTICFAIFFSFVGTVLGGLWADDSWGRFWGWDPKENGALIIVLWNAIILHARWDGMVRERGLAVLAVVGNIVTSWSWFGVNELSVGLHSYGFTEGVLLALGLFVLSQMMIAAVGCLPRDKWLSGRGSDDEDEPYVARLA